jgi:hypothetical protein
MDHFLQEEQELTDIVNEFNDKCEGDYRINRPRHINESVQGGTSSLLIKCVMYGHVDLVKRCIKLGSRLEDYDAYGRTALCWALREDHIEIIKILLKAGANPNVKITQSFDRDPIPIIFYIVNRYYMYRPRLDLLLKYGALIHEINKYQDVLIPTTLRYFRKLLAKRRWVVIKCIVLALGIHKRAVVTANHPLRLLERGEFEEKEDI